MAALLLALACKLPAYSPSDPHSHGGGTDTSTTVDADQDGYNAAVDCNDADASVHPGTKETCGNGVDDNCNGVADGCAWDGEGALGGWAIAGSDIDERFGSTLAVCDANGDGQEDLVVGSAGTNDDAGAVTVFYGPLGETGEPNPPWKIFGRGPSTTFGSALDCHSDVTGDGAADLLIGEPDETGDTSGAMYIVPAGDTGQTTIADAYTTVWYEPYGSDRFGYGVFAIDADGEDGDEIAVTAIGGPDSASAQYGATYIVGSSPGNHTTSSADDYVFGEPGLPLQGTSGNAGDMNGDGIDELALTAQGSPWGTTDVVLLYGHGVSGAIGAEDADVEIETGGRFVARWTQLGHADLNGDGYDDFLLGDPDEDRRGVVLAFFGVLDEGTYDAPDVELKGRDDSYTGRAIASPGDLDGDGRAELLIGAPGAGGVYLYRGGDSGSFALDYDAQASWWAAEDASDAGAALAAGNLMDVIDEFVVGVPYAGEDNKGAVVLVPSLEL